MKCRKVDSKSVKNTYSVYISSKPLIFLQITYELTLGCADIYLIINKLFHSQKLSRKPR